MNEIAEQMIDTPTIIAKLADLDKRLKSNADDRHAMNNQLHKTLNTLADKTGQQDDVLSNIKSTVGEVVETVRRIEVSLIGDSKYDRQGLIKDVLEIKAVQISLDTRLQLAEEAIKANSIEVRHQRKMVIIAVSIVASIGAVVGWLKANGIIQFLSS